MLPELALDRVAELVSNFYGIKGSIKKLGGGSDLNYLIQQEDKPEVKYVFKISSSEEHQVLIKIQSYILSNIAAFSQKVKVGFPQVIKGLNGEDIVLVKDSNTKNLARLFRYIEGHELWEVQNPSQKLIFEIGTVTGHLSLYLAEISERQEVKSLISKVEMEKYRQNIIFFCQSYKKGIQFVGEEFRAAIDASMNSFNAIIPILRQLPGQMIHNDLCISNLLVDKKGDQYFLSGVIDFSAAVFSYGIVQLAILAARINMDPSDPLKNLMLIVKGFNSVRKLTSVEKDLLFVLIKARLGFIMLLVCWDFAQNPENSYLAKNIESIGQYIKIFSQLSEQEFQKKLEGVLAQ